MVRILGSLGLVVVLSATAYGQGAPAQSFDAADIHGVPLTPFSGGGGVPVVGVLRGGRYEVRGATMVDLIRTAYNVDADTVLGGPSWLETDRFDVVADAPAGLTQDAARVMLQGLLAERFALTLHKDTKPVPAFVLLPGKAAPKMKPASGSGQPGCQGQPPAGPPAPGAAPVNTVSCHDMTMAAFALQVRQMANAYLDHDVADQTKLAGSWDFDLSWTPRGALAAAGPDGISIFDAVEKQMGLKLELQTAPTAVLVVEKVNQKPTPNLPGVGTGSSDGPLEFEAADIKPSAPGSAGFRFLYQNGGRINGEGFLRDFIASAFNVTPNLSADLIVGGPKFLETARYEIVAKTPTTGAGAPTHDGGREAPPPLDVALKMLRSMLEDRFKLKTHSEDRPVTVYAISLARGATPKLKKADDTERAGCKPAPDAAPASANATPVIAYRCQNTTMTELAQNVQGWANGYFDHPAFDATGISGGYDFVLSWTPKGALHPATPAATTGGAAVDPGGLSVFEAIEKELGLKVTTEKHNIPVTVIDHIEEKPTDN